MYTKIYCVNLFTLRYIQIPNFCQLQNRFEQFLFTSLMQNYPNYPSSTSQPYSVINQQHKHIFSSRLNQHSKDPNTDRLYEPLRHTVQHPEYQFQHRMAQQHAIKSSHLSHQYKQLNRDNLETIKNQTYITDHRLRPTNHYEKVANKQFFIIDADQRQGNPISQQQMQNRLRNLHQQDDIVVYSNDSSSVSAQKMQVIPLHTTIKMKQGSQAKKTGKYNLYSMLDQPFQRIKTSGCKAFKCPPNQCIASEEKYSWFP